MQKKAQNPMKKTKASPSTNYTHTKIYFNSIADLEEQY